MIKTLLLDIEGTVCSIKYVHNVLFPYARSAADRIIPSLTSHFPVPAETSATSTITPASSSNVPILSYLAAFPEPARQSPSAMLAYIHDLIDRDVKDPALKALQGFLWKEGYASGEIKAPIYPDSIDAIIHYSKTLPLGVSIYSSGSVPAQKLLFQHTQVPSSSPAAAAADGSSGVLDLTKNLHSYYDTVNAGPKTESASYTAIAKDLGLADTPQDILFLSDNPKEVDAAHKAGLEAYIVVRPDNAPLPEGASEKYKIIETLKDVL